MTAQQDTLRAVFWQNNQLHLLDQRYLPWEHNILIFDNAPQVAQAIQDMVVRGAPAIGITAAYAVVLAAQSAYQRDLHHWQTLIVDDIQRLAQARPTAVNLVWALERMQACYATLEATDPVPRLLAEAQRIHQEDIAANYRMGELGAAQLPSNCRVLTHCNAGALATGGYGTALGVIRYGYHCGTITQVYADETRPWLQGARLTAWELLHDNIPVTLLADNAAAALMQHGYIDWVIVGADRIAANGDVANKIGTYNLALLAKHHGVQFMVVAPSSTLDLTLTQGTDIVIEQRPHTEVLTLAQQPIAPAQAQAWNPAFDITPAALIDCLVTEKGVVVQPTTAKLSALVS
ncbi:MAG: S-methyl-5-thioribose-1-phosphate isomerase [Pseudomonadota bacterium]|nr:S-methyl-5-thioribose-1-phosphate isomerase [Pseudomonadota bacterium]